MDDEDFSIIISILTNHLSCITNDSGTQNAVMLTALAKVDIVASQFTA